MPANLAGHLSRRGFQGFIPIVHPTFSRRFLRMSPSVFSQDMRDTMPTMAKLYTRTGDDGTTGLFGGQRVSKDDRRVDAYGNVDECNAALGLCVAGLPSTESMDLLTVARKPREAALSEMFRPILTTLQSRLFDLGADLATPHGSK